jgi:hypothetical protein
MTVAFCHSDDKRNLNVIPTEKFFCFDEQSECHSDREVFLLRRGIFLFSKGKDSSVAKSSFRMTAAFCHSDREALFASTRNLNVIPTEKLFASTRNLCAFDKKRFFSREKLLQNDSGVLSFRQRSFFASARNLNVIPTEKFFLLRRGISVSFRQRSSFDFDEESMCFR